MAATRGDLMFKGKQGFADCAPPEHMIFTAGRRWKSFPAFGKATLE